MEANRFLCQMIDRWTTTVTTYDVDAYEIRKRADYCVTNRMHELSLLKQRRPGAFSY